MLKKIPKSLELSKHKCTNVFIDRKGLLRIPMKDDIKHVRMQRFQQYYDLLCVINGHTSIVEIPFYPKIFIYNESNYLKQLKISMLAAKMKIQGLPNVIYGNNNLSVIAFRNNDKEGKLRAITRVYLQEYNIPLIYTPHAIRGSSESDVKAYVLRRHIENVLISNKKPLDKKNHLKEYDRQKRNKFVEFNNYYNAVKKEEEEFLEKELASARFAKFYSQKEKEIFTFRFNFNEIKDKNKTISNLLFEKELNKFEKEIDNLRK